MIEPRPFDHGEGWTFSVSGMLRRRLKMVSSLGGVLRGATAAVGSVGANAMPNAEANREQPVPWLMPDLANAA